MQKKITWMWSAWISGRGIASHLICFGLLCVSPLQAAQTSGPRLIKTGQHEIRWLEESQIQDLAFIQHSLGRCGGYMDVTENQDLRNQTPIDVPKALVGRVPAFADRVNPALKILSESHVAESVETLSTGFHNRHYQSETGVAAAHWVQGQFIALSKGRKDVTVKLFNHSFKQPSVIATIAGAGTQAAETVILGAHLDSINWNTGFGSSADRAPGADDDASGVATVLETFRALMDSNFVPERTIQFIAYAGEERGLLGSQDIASQYKREGVEVIGVLQLDMTAYPSRKVSERGISIITDHVSPDLTGFMKRLIDEYVKIPWHDDQCGYACSDHASWDSAGFPSAFPFEAPFDQHNPTIHSVEDLSKLLDFEFSLHFAKLATAFAVELGSER